MLAEIRLEAAGSGASLGCVGIPESMSSLTSCWLDLQRLVYDTIDNKCSTQMLAVSIACVRLFDEHNGPELTGLDNPPCFSRWTNWIRSLENSQKTKVLSVGAYPVLDVCKFALAHKWICLEDTVNAQYDKPCVMAAVNAEGCQLRFACEALQHDYQVVERALQQNGRALYVTKLNKRPELILLALKSTRYADIPSELSSDREFALQAVQVSNTLCLFRDLQDDESVVLKAVQSHAGAFANASIRLRADKQFALAAIASGGAYACAFVYKTLAKDPDIAALTNKMGYALMHMKSSQMTKSLVLDQVSKNGHQLEYAKQYQDDKEVAMAAVTQCGAALCFCSIFLQDDQDVVMQAVAQDGLSLRFASLRLKSDYDVCSAAVRQNAHAVKTVSSLHVSSLHTSMIRLAVKCHGVSWLSTLGMTIIANDDISLAQHFVACWPPEVVAEQAFKCSRWGFCFRILHFLAASKQQLT